MMGDFSSFLAVGSFTYAVLMVVRFIDGRKAKWKVLAAKAVQILFMKPNEIEALISTQVRLCRHDALAQAYEYDTICLSL